MLGKRAIDAVCVAAMLLAVLLMAGFAAAGATGAIEPDRDDAYLDRLFAAGTVHRIDIRIGDWDAFLASAPSEAYVRCDVSIDGEEVADVGIRTKGNNSLAHLSERGAHPLQPEGRVRPLP